jgi:hypothetical protein
MAKRCRHRNGVFTEVSQALHLRDVRDGVMESEGENQIGPIVGHVFTCGECGKRFWVKWNSPKWLMRLYHQL